MSNLFDDAPEAHQWAKSETARYADVAHFREIKSGVVWADHLGDDGQLLVPIDPALMVAEIDSTGLNLLNGHDPGLPIGRILSAANFKTASGTQFVAAVFGFYGNDNITGFESLGVVPTPDQLPPLNLPPLDSSSRIEFYFDPREIDARWIETVLSEAPLRVEQGELSHNAAVTLYEVIKIGLPYAAVAWNPFVKTIATDAGKDVYAALKRWMLAFVQKTSELNSPIVELIVHIDLCQVSFLFRGKDVKKNYVAAEGLATASEKAAILVKNMLAIGLQPVEVIYEFRHESEIWCPSFARLKDGSLITDNAKLIAVEQLPKSLSLGLILPKQSDS